MLLRPETPAPPAGRLVAGHFSRGPRYFAYRQNGTQDWLLTYTIRGSGRYRFSGGEIETSPGELVLVAPSVVHDYHTAPRAGRWEPLWVHFLPRPDWLPLMKWSEAATGIGRLRLPARERPALVREFRRVITRAAAPSRHAQLSAMNALEAVLIHCDEVNPASAALSLDPRLRRAAELIHAELTATHSLPALARHAGLSPSRFTHLFQAAFGAAPVRYRELQRLNRAAELLRVTQEPVRARGADNSLSFQL